MSNPTTRILTVLELLQSHERISGSELARRLEVDVRTVRRYIAALEELGIPVTADQGRYGGYYLVAGFKLPPMMFTNEETLAVSLGLSAAHQLGLTDAASAIASAKAKLERVMPSKLKQHLQALSEMAVIDLPSGRPLGSIKGLADLSSAARGQQSVSFGYQSSEGTASDRDFDPYGLVFRRGNWYAGGYCHLRQTLRTFRLDRMQHLRMLDAHFERPVGFDIAKFLSHSIANIDREHPVVVRLHTTLEKAMEQLSAEAGMLIPERDAVLLHTSTGCMEWCARTLCRLPFPFSVDSPPALREAVRQHAQQILNNLNVTP